MIYYADTSALVKRYLNEIGSQWIRSGDFSCPASRDLA